MCIGFRSQIYKEAGKNTRDRLKIELQVSKFIDGISQGDEILSRRKIYLLSTGGTIEKTYDEFEGSLQNRETTIKSNLVTRLRLPNTDVEVKVLMAKDSLHMDQQDRHIISLACDKFEDRCSGMVVLHGTDTMDQTVKYIFAQKTSYRVPIVFTGAMKPLGFIDSDALQNVTEAIFAAQLANPGLYISFHGGLFPAPNVRKNKTTGTFESY